MDAEFQDEVIEVLKAKANDIFGTDPTTLSGATTFAELGCKSVNIVQFASALEDEYEVEVPFMKLNKCATFQDAAKLVDEELSM